MTAPETPRPPDPAGVASVREVLAELGADRHTSGPLSGGGDTCGPLSAGGPDGGGQPADRLARLEAAHRRLRQLLEQPDA